LESKMETVCAVVVTYNRKKLLLECLEALKRQTRPVQGIYLIDNSSTDGTPDLLLEKGYIKELPPNNLQKPWEKEFEVKNLKDNQLIRFYYVRMHENTGSSGGFHEGVKRAYEKGYDWLWLMDDDVEPKKNCLEYLINTEIKNIDKTHCVRQPIRIYEDGEFVKSESTHINLKNPFFSLKQGFVKISHCNGTELVEISNFPFEGPIIPANIIKDVGLPNKNFFIIADDTDYAIRIKKKGYKIFLICDAVLYRKIKIINNKDINWKSYYYIRNTIILDRLYGSITVKHLRPILYFLRLLIASILKGKFKNIKYILQAFWDGYRLKFNKGFNK